MFPSPRETGLDRGWGWELAGTSTQFSPQLHINCNPGTWRWKQENQKIKVIFV